MKIIPFDKLDSIRTNRNKKIVHCHGVFDLLHYGHLQHLRSAKKFGDILVVTITSDKFVNKGPDRPRFGEVKRAEMLSSLEIVDYVAISDYKLAIPAIEKLQPNYYVKGPDYKDKNSDITGGIKLEEDTLSNFGGKLIFTDDQVESSTRLINQFMSQWNDEQESMINRIKNNTGVKKILELINNFSNLNVLVIGEPIIDTYVFCKPENLSSKSPSISSRYINEENYTGGSLAIARHLTELGCKVTLKFTHGGENYFQDMLSQFIEETRCNLDTTIIQNIPTPRKTRYIEPSSAQRMFELIDIRSDQWLHAEPDKFITSLDDIDNYDMVIVADFGHGLIEGKVLQTINNSKNFISLNVQTNSENYGFNCFHKYKKIDYLSIDERECRIGMHDRTSSIDSLARELHDKLKIPMSITLGAKGSMFFDEDGRQNICPSLFNFVLDTTGAGDAYFLLTSLLQNQNIEDPLVIPFLGNIYAGIKTGIIGNSSSVSKIDFIKTLKSILG